MNRYKNFSAVIDAAFIESAELDGDPMGGWALRRVFWTGMHAQIGAYIDLYGVPESWARQVVEDLADNSVSRPFTPAERTRISTANEEFEKYWDTVPFLDPTPTDGEIASMARLIANRCPPNV